MAKFGYLTPRYLVNRARWFWYERRNPDKPWLTPAANAMLSTLLLPTDIGIEWGSGRSTRWFARQLKHLTSVEHHPQWYEKVKAQLTAAGVTNVDYIHAPDFDSPDYFDACSRFADGSLDFALVDGESRDRCALAVLPKIAPGGLLVIDNINWYLDYPSHSPISRTGRGHLDEQWARVAQPLKSWRMIWTSSGVTDTAIWIRPRASAS